MSDRLTIEEVEEKAKSYGQYKHRLVLLQLAATMRENERLRKALEFADSVIYSEFCTGRNPDGSDRIALDGYEIIKEALSNKESA